jgi:hypothetical protein
MFVAGVTPVVGATLLVDRITVIALRAGDPLMWFNWAMM